ncbi:MAG: serine/threonine protein kinase [Thermoanaerobaculia bacterium]
MTEQSLSGRRFGEYEVLEELGSGGMGKVYRAKNVTLERVVALKTMAPDFSSDEEFVRRFLKEARVAARLNHPNIVQIYDFGCVEGIHYLAMEYVDGESLGARLRRGRLGERDALQVVRQAARALSVAHSEGIVHRDIKPDNLMLTSRGDLKLVDLGIAKRVDEEQGLTQTGQAVGTPHYISPEQIRGLKDIDARADVYSLGATFYHLVTGHAPYKGTSGALVMSMHLTQPLPDPRQYEPSISEGLCRVLRKTMAKEREERYPSMEALDRDLLRLQTGEMPEGEEPSVTQIATQVDSNTPVGARPRSPYPGASVGPASTPPPALAPAFREEDLHFVEIELARHIGPLARVLVKKAAKTAVSLVALGAVLAEQIPDEKGRRDFRAAVRARAK